MCRLLVLISTCRLLNLLHLARFLSVRLIWNFFGGFFYLIREQVDLFLILRLLPPSNDIFHKVLLNIKPWHFLRHVHLWYRLVLCLSDWVNQLETHVRTLRIRALALIFEVIYTHFQRYYYIIA